RRAPDKSTVRTQTSTQDDVSRAPPPRRRHPAGHPAGATDQQLPACQVSYGVSKPTQYPSAPAPGEVSTRSVQYVNRPSGSGLSCTLSTSTGGTGIVPPRAGSTYT